MLDWSVLLRFHSQMARNELSSVAGTYRNADSHLSAHEIRSAKENY